MCNGFCVSTTWKKRKQLQMADEKCFLERKIHSRRLFVVDAYFIKLNLLSNVLFALSVSLFFRLNIKVTNFLQYFDTFLVCGTIWTFISLLRWKLRRKDSKRIFWRSKKFSGDLWELFCLRCLIFEGFFFWGVEKFN